MRLNQAMRDHVAKKALTARYQKEVRAHRAEFLTIGNALWDAMFHDVRRALDKIPRRYLLAKTTERTRAVQFCFNKARGSGDMIVLFSDPEKDLPGVTATFNVHGKQMPFITTRPLPRDIGYNHEPVGSLHAGDDNELAERARAWYDHDKELRAEMEQAVHTLCEMLKGTPTFERLQADWPAGERFYKSLPVDFPYQHTVPAVAVKDLNRMLGLAT